MQPSEFSLVTPNETGLACRLMGRKGRREKMKCRNTHQSRYCLPSFSVLSLCLCHTIIMQASLSFFCRSVTKSNWKLTVSIWRSHRHPGVSCWFWSSAAQVSQTGVAEIIGWNCAERKYGQNCENFFALNVDAFLWLYFLCAEESWNLYFLEVKCIQAPFDSDLYF